MLCMGLKGNRVKIPSDPVTVNGESTAYAIVPIGMRRRGRALSRKSGNLLRRNGEYLPKKVAYLKNCIEHPHLAGWGFLVYDFIAIQRPSRILEGRFWLYSP